METLEYKINDAIKIKKSTMPIIPKVIDINTKGRPYVKLYQTINDACNETINHAWHPLEIILALNTKSRPIYDSGKYDCGVEGNVVSLTVRIKDNWFSKINKLEIIYI